MNLKSSKIIGRLEMVNFPEWGFYEIEAKIDTGAYTSSLHCHHIEPVKINGKEKIRFYLLDPDHPAYSDKMLEMPIAARKAVKSSNGESELRYFVRTNIEILGETYSIELSLTDRSAMKYPLLIGRKFIAKGSFLVDVNRKNTAAKVLNKENKK